MICSDLTLQQYRALFFRRLLSTETDNECSSSFCFTSRQYPSARRGPWTHMIRLVDLPDVAVKTVPMSFWLITLSFSFSETFFSCSVRRAITAVNVTITRRYTADSYDRFQFRDLCSCNASPSALSSCSRDAFH